MIRRGTSYGPSLPPGVLEDDGADRGSCSSAFSAVARAVRVRPAQWVNDGKFIGAPAERDPLTGPNEDGASSRSQPSDPPPPPGLPDFVVNRGGEYCFMPACGRCAGSPISTPELRRFVVADHFSGPAGPRRPRVRRHRRVHLSQPERPGHLVLVLDVFPSAAPPRCSPTRCATGSASGR
jgi:hypothetical protein